MLVSHRHKFIFIKGVKVAGTSSEVFFQPACQPADRPVSEGTETYEGPEGIVAARADFSKAETRPKLRNHMSAQSILDVVGPEVFDRYVKIANICNPFTQALSGVYHKAFRAGRSFDELAALQDELRQLVDRKNPFAKRLSVDGEIAVDVPIRFEALEEDCQRVARQIGYAPPAPPPHLKNRPKPFGGVPVEDILPADVVDALLEKEAAYFRRFGYSTDPAQATAPPPILSETAQ